MEEIAGFLGCLASTCSCVRALYDRTQLETAEHAIPGNSVHIAGPAFTIVSEQFVDGLPKNASSKILRRELRAIDS